MPWYNFMWIEYENLSKCIKNKYQGYKLLSSYVQRQGSVSDYMYMQCVLLLVEANTVLSSYAVTM